MSGPYPYFPYYNPYISPIYNAPHYSPFVPDMHFSSSPFSNSGSLPPSPNNTSGSPLPASSCAFQLPATDYIGASEALARNWRGRRPSWHGVAPTLGHETDWLKAPTGHTRANSHGASTTPFWSAATGTTYYPTAAPSYWPPTTPSPGYSGCVQHHVPPLLPLQMPPFMLHYWLEGRSPRNDFYFNLSLAEFSPMRYMGPGKSTMLPTEELSQPATHPPITRLRIICKAIPQWPIILEYKGYHSGVSGSPGSTYVPPITLGDVLSAVHREMQIGITHEDWAKLTPDEVIAVGKAYTRRCRKMGNDTSQRSKGVKKVDYLQKKVWFRGLVRTGPGYDEMEMIVA